jgi:hypothetical protein
MTYVLVTVSGGIIDRVVFFENRWQAVWELARFVSKMNLEKKDAAVYGPDGLLANAKALMDEESEVPEADREEKGVPSKDKPVYVMADSHHTLGFLVVGRFEPLGYADPLEALAALERIRKELGTNINLYRLVPVRWKIAGREELEKYNADHSVRDFEYSLVSEFLR